jgi:hypothetical protein
MTLVGVALALTMAVLLGKAVFAQGPGTDYGRGGMMAVGNGPGYDRGNGGPQQSLVAVAAETLGMSQTDLVAELRGGKTIAQVATEKNVAPDAIADAFVATRAARLEAAVAAGRLTPAEAEARLVTMRTTVAARLNAPWSPQGNGPGSGFVDQDGDGVCDTATTGQPRGGRMGGGRMGGGRMGAGPMSGPGNQ